MGDLSGAPQSPVPIPFRAITVLFWQLTHLPPHSRPLQGLVWQLVIDVLTVCLQHPLAVRQIPALLGKRPKGLAPSSSGPCGLVLAVAVIKEAAALFF